MLVSVRSRQGIANSKTTLVISLGFVGDSHRISLMAVSLRGGTRLFVGSKGQRSQRDKSFQHLIDVNGPSR